MEDEQKLKDKVEEIVQSEIDKAEKESTLSVSPTETPINDKLISIEGNIQWRIVVNTETKQTQVLFNASVSNECAILGLSHQIIDGIIKHSTDQGVKPKEMTRLRITQFEMQKLFGRCLTYLMDNKDKELTQKEETK